jgi:hypothetical protein
MKIVSKHNTMWLGVMLVCALSIPAPAAELLTNGGFESGFAGWSRIDQLGSEGTFSVQTGMQSPVNTFTVPPPPQGTTAAMTDAAGPGSHVLYQDFVVPTMVPNLPAMFLSFALYVNNDRGAPNFVNAANLDFSTPALNQQARVDIMTSSADPFSVVAADILQSIYRTNAGDPLVSGYTNFSVNITSLLQANQGQTLRLRFAEVDNVAPFNLGVDRVSISDVNIPEPSTVFMTLGGLLGAVFVRRRLVS